MKTLRGRAIAYYGWFGDFVMRRAMPDLATRVREPNWRKRGEAERQRNGSASQN